MTETKPWTEFPHATRITQVIAQANRLTKAERDLMSRALRDELRTPGGGVVRLRALNAALRALTNAHGKDHDTYIAIKSVPVDVMTVVIAVMASDQIGLSPDWDQSAYDLLTAHWVEVVGPISDEAVETSPFAALEEAATWMLETLIGEYPSTAADAERALQRVKKLTRFALLVDATGILR